MSVPAIVYKYRQISPQTETLISKREIYFPLASEINDPFDCRIVLNREAPPETLWEMTKAHYSKKFSLSDEEDIIYHMLLESAPNRAQVTRAMATEIIREKKGMSLI